MAEKILEDPGIKWPGKSQIVRYVTLQLKPGDRLTIKLLNELKPASNVSKLDDFQKLNPTNLHLHGFLVAPEWPAHPADRSGTLNPPPWFFGENIVGMFCAAFHLGATTTLNALICEYL